MTRWLPTVDGRMTWSRARRSLLAAVVALAAGACVRADHSNDVDVSGSSTVEPITIRVAELLEDRDDDVLVNVDGPGTGDGFKLFCGGETDISDASRPIKEEEAADCEAAGIDPIELTVAFDGLAVLTSPENPLDCLTFADLYALVGPEAEGVRRWSDAEDLAHELGSTTRFPDVPLDLTAPGEESGTFDSFVELALADIAEARAEEGHVSEEEAATTRPDYQSQADDSAIIQGIEGSRGSLGWVGYAFAAEAGDEVKQLAIDGGEGCVEPTAEAIADGSYPLSRPLFIYVSAEALLDNPDVTTFVDFYLGDGMQAVEEVGYVPLNDEQLRMTRAVWRARPGGSTASS